MKKTILNLALIIAASVTLSSCYTYTSVIGKGAQGHTEVSGKNNYLIAGLVPIGVSDSKKMAGGATDYTITTTHTFIDGLLGAITFSIYTPTTTTVTK